MCAPKSEGGMGFKDLKTFNKALLVKQGWRILHETSSLLHKIYKAKYFPHVNFLEAGLGEHPSYAWRGIWEAKGLLKQGSIWMVGNGKTINIWSDHWIPSFRPSSYSSREAKHSLKDAMVSYLIDQDTNRWEVEKINNLFQS